MNIASDEKQGWLGEFRARVVVELRELRRREVAWSWGRLISFAGTGGVVYLLRENAVFALAAAGLMLACFFGCVRAHLHARSRRIVAENLQRIVDESTARCGGRLTVVRMHERPSDPAGPAIALPALFDEAVVDALTEQERGDLDLYTGPVGLFGLLNRTSTSSGARRLRDMLEHPCLTPDAVIARQQVVRWLDDHPEARMRLMAATVDLRGRHKESDLLIAAVHSATPFPSARRVVWLRIWGFVSFVAAAVAAYQCGRARYVWGAGLFLLVGLNYLLLLDMRNMVQTVLAPWSGLLLAVRGCREATETGGALLPNESHWTVIRECLSKTVHDSILHRLERRLAWTDSAGMVHAILNVVAFWDLQLAASILHAVLPHKDQLLRTLSTLTEVDALSSLGTFAWEQPQTCYPQVTKRKGLRIESGVHPLLDSIRAVANDVTLTEAQRTLIVTGSNMAGKSTFLRMIGVNALLAQIGTVATARSMAWQPMRLITDLRAADSLADSESYFLAEVRHVRRMVLPPEDGIPCLGLIDEPFRGTNSQEQVAASLAVAEHLIASPHFFIIATHDQKLTELADDVHARNVHFREQLDGDDMVFDYRLRPGPAQTRNALLVLERVGYPAALLDRARRRLLEGT